MDNQFLEDVLFGDTGGSSAAPVQRPVKPAKEAQPASTAEVDDSFIDEVLGNPTSSPQAENVQAAPSKDEGILLAQVRRANALSHKERIPFPEALERVQNEDISFGGGVVRTVGKSFRNRMVGIGQATGLDDLTGAAMKKIGMIPEDADVDAALRESVTERNQEMDRVKEKAPVGGMVGDFAGDAAALAPTLVTAGTSLPAVLATGAVAGAAEGFTRSEGVGEDRSRGMDALIGGVVGTASGGLFYGAGKAYSRFLSDKVNRAVGKGIDHFNKQKFRGADRFSAEGQRLLRERGFDPARINSKAASDFFRDESNALTSAQRLTNKVNKILKDTDPAKVRENVARFEELGIDPTLGQATGNPALMAVERNLGLRGNPAISEPIKARMRTQAHEQLPVSTQVMLDRMSTDSLEAVSDRLVNVSRLIRDDMLSEQAKRAAPLYQEALQPARRIASSSTHTVDKSALSKIKKQVDAAKPLLDPEDFSADEIANILPRVAKSEVKAARASLKGGMDEVEKIIPIKSLVTDQDGVAAIGVKQSFGNDEAIDVLQIGDRFYVDDGNHRAIAALLEGKTSIKARITKPKGTKVGAYLSEKEQRVKDLLAHPRIKNLIKQVRKDMDVAPDVEGLADDSVPFMHEVKMRLDGLVGKAKSSGDRDRARRLTQLKNQLVSALDDATIAEQDLPDIGVKAGESIYKKARNIYSDDQDLIDKFQDGVLGAVADLSEGRVDKATKNIFAMRDINRFREAKNRIRAKDPELWDAMVARHITDVLEELPAVPNKDYRAFAKKLAGKERTGKFLQVALEDNKPTQRLFNDMMLAIDDLTNLDLANHPKGSPTMMYLDKTNYVDDHFEDVKLKAVSKISTDLLKDVGDEFQNKQLIGTLSDLARLLTDPDSVNDMARGQIQRRVSNYIMGSEGQGLAKGRMGKVLNRHDRAMMFYRAVLGEHTAGKALDTAGKAVQPAQKTLIAPEAVDKYNNE